MANIYLRKYGVDTTIDFELYGIDGASLNTTATFAAGDTTRMLDEAAQGNLGASPTDEGSTYSLAIAAAELQCTRLIIHVVDQTSPKVWLDCVLIVETYGHTSAMHAFDLDSATVTPADGSVTAAVIAADAIDADSIKADAATEVAAAVWNSAVASYTTNVTFGKYLGGAPAGATLAADIAEILTDTGTTLDSLLDAATPALIADAVWDELVAGHTTNVSFGKYLGAAPVGATLAADIAEILTDTGTTLDSLLDAATPALIADAVWNEISTGHTTAGYAGAQLWTDIDAILTDTGTTLDDLLDAATPALIADAVWNELTAGHVAAASFGLMLENVPSLTELQAVCIAGPGAGAGANTVNYTLTNEASAPIVDADVWVTSDLAGTSILASGRTNSSGIVTFFLDAGTVYVWRQKPGVNFTNPETKAVA